MSPNMILILVSSIVLVVWWQLTTMSKKVLCTYRRPSRQRLTKFVPLDQQKVRFDNLEFTILPDRAGLQWYKLLWGLLGNIGTWIIAYDFTWQSEFPQDPSNYWISNVSGATRRATNNQDSYTAFNRSVDKQSGRKGTLSQYFPFIVMGLIMLIALYYFYNQINVQNLQLKAMSD